MFFAKCAKMRGAVTRLFTSAVYEYRGSTRLFPQSGLYMSYQVYFADLTEENRTLLLALLRLKEESEKLEPGEGELLFSIRGGPAPEPLPMVDEPPARPSRGRRPPRRNNRSHSSP